MSTKYSMDIPHVAAVEYPLIINNSAKATSMIGGKAKISKVVNSSENGPNILELKLRNDAFHHPIQSSFSSNEKILLKISIPKKSLPKDFDKKRIRELINAENSTQIKLNPVAIIDKTYLFKSIADFQINTKNNKTVQQFNRLFLNLNNFTDIDNFFQSHDGLVNLQDFITTEKDYFVNVDHELPPPPVFSSIRFPFDYKYQKNPYTTAVKDVTSGEIKVVSTRNTVKLYTKMVDFGSEVPLLPNEKLVESLKELAEDSGLLKCIEWLRTLFEVKPIWLRKQLEDLVASEDDSSKSKHLKQAIPYVLYLYKSGPWRFCNIKYGVDPQSHSDFWVYQSEYFRIPGLKFKKNREVQRVVPTTIKAVTSTILISELLFFNGISLPSTVTFQIGDLLDLDITTILEDHQKSMTKDFLRDKVDFQDGWINRQTMQVVRRIVRYKLNRIAKDEPLDQNKIYKIINTDYTEEEEDEEEEDGVVEDEEEEEEEEEGVVDERTILTKLDEVNYEILGKLEGLLGYIKQDGLTL